MKQKIQQQQHNPLLTAASKAASDANGIFPEEILNRGTRKSVNWARHMTWRLLILEGWSQIEISRATGRSMGSVCNSLKRCDGYLRNDPEFRETFLKARMNIDNEKAARAL